MEDWQMKINWGRVLNAGLIAEILLIGLYQIFASLHGNFDQANYIFVVVGSFVFMLVGALWVGQKIESRFVLHGFLVGVVAIVYYVIRSLPDALSGQYPVNYWLGVLIGHPPKLLGGIVGGYLARRRKTKTV
jgi:putative membrane protein (TIGR04086 family)